MYIYKSTKYFHLYVEQAEWAVILASLSIIHIYTCLYQACSNISASDMIKSRKRGITCMKLLKGSVIVSSEHFKCYNTGAKALPTSGEQRPAL